MVQAVPTIVYSGLDQCSPNLKSHSCPEGRLEHDIEYWIA